MVWLRLGLAADIAFCCSSHSSRARGRTQPQDVSTVVVEIANSGGWGREEYTYPTSSRYTGAKVG